MKGLMERVPRYYAQAWAEDVDFRDFSSMDEVRQTGEVLDELAAAADTCFTRLGVPAPSHADLEKDDTLVCGIEEIDLRNIVATGFVNFATGGEFDIRPLEKTLIGSVFEVPPGGTEREGRRLRREAVDAFLACLRERSGLEGEAWRPLERFALRALGNLEEELKKVPSWTDLDPRYVRSVMIKRESGEGHLG